MSCALHRWEQVQPEHMRQTWKDAVENVLLPATSLSMTWSRSGRRSPRAPAVVSLGGCPDIVRHKGATQLLRIILSWTNLLHHFSLSFLGCFWFHPSIGWLFLPYYGANTSLTHYQERYPRFFSPHLDLMCFQSVPLIISTMFWNIVSEPLAGKQRCGHLILDTIRLLVGSFLVSLVFVV